MSTQILSIAIFLIIVGTHMFILFIVNVLSLSLFVWCRFQDTWQAKYPWSEQDAEGDGRFEKVRCVICSKINGRDKILDAKDDNLKKHQGGKNVSLICLT